MSLAAKLILCIALLVAGFGGGVKFMKGVQAQKDLATAQSSAKETIRRLDNQQENQNAQNALLAKTRRDVAGAVSAAGRLQQRIDQLSDPATVAKCPAITALGDALRRSAESYRRLAESADLDRAAGLKCEADYDGLAK